MATDPRERKLTDAINAALQEYYLDAEEPTYIIDWMVITSETNPERVNTSGIGMFYPNGELSWITALGLTEAARLRLHAGWMNGSVRDD